ncbi:MAG: 3-phosphoshikimate 1-carboxyvinyltransferase [Candidatus Omnitrophica bacterium CG08_land_8_20_14_0_20_41_16]|uniref:3-phosphoshikimate 1-carboxyvinyltransferase n=1 Tax=Candidatus Sherwoodlollariibacterium unditelluris TaxID=1974757 RepID=A0A2G9YJL2_9BACT|nr:MAG: 3-phosphoshikimate 1-carboxyvinyltransferase [Candidatus Omnitrophica bacterium CG23_combo_of_CG06-09_8_20_14_all_41_10]PIS34466.1 MAG: 3-phosphoshikimate 1-carboxyvinyltransferase [Candidatus Omnitrophica bacterium CG08_land_8_20_14_0_20_41_16]
MKPYDILPSSRFKGRIILPGDKSIAHRAVIVSSISSGRTVIDNFPVNNDCKVSISAFHKLGFKIKRTKSDKIIVFGKGLNGLTRPKGCLFIEESGTTFRLLLGILAAQKFETKLTAGKVLSQRPMLRVIAPLRKMGAKITAKLSSPRNHEPANSRTRELTIEEYPPIVIKGGNLKGITYKMPVASAQVKSAILLAGLYAHGQTEIIEPVKTRDHTERMLQLFRAKIKHKGNAIVLKGRQGLVSPGVVYIPGDISSAAFFMVAAAIVPGSSILIKKVSLNPTRLGIIKVLKRMGMNIRLTNRELKVYEPRGDILVKSSSLKGVRILRREVPSLIDEVPILMVAASYAKGRTVFEGVGELRVKETDRIRSMSENLKKMGADIRVVRAGKSENIIIQGVGQLKGASLKSFGDHRTAMSAVIAGLAASGKSSIDDVSCINKSLPEFLSILKSII